MMYFAGAKYDVMFAPMCRSTHHARSVHHAAQQYIM
jgi:hypothetical protein